MVALAGVLARLGGDAEPEAAEVGRGVRLLGEFLGVGPQHPAEGLGGPPVAGHVRAGGHPVPGGVAHPVERGAGRGKVRLLPREFPVYPVVHGNLR